MGDIPVVTVEQQKQHFFELMQLHRKCQHIVSELSQGSEEDIIHILKQMEQMRQKWLASYNENQGMKTIIENMNTESVQLRTENKKLQALVTESRAQISALMTRQETVDAQRQQFEEAFELLRQILNDDNEGASTLLNAETKQKMLKLQAKHDRNKDAAHASIASEDNVSYDQTNDELDVEDINVSTLRSGTLFRRDEVPAATKKRSRSRSANRRGPMSFSVAPPTIQEEIDAATPKKKRSRGEKSADAAAAAPVVPMFPRDEVMQPAAEIPYLRPVAAPRQHRVGPSGDGRISPLNRSFSVPDLSMGNKEQPHDAAGPHTPAASYALRAFASSTSLTPRLHSWTSKNIYTSEHCDECLRAGKSKGQSRIAFARKAFTCANCKVTVCESCRDRAQMPPCVPKMATPRKNQRGFLAEFCSAIADPMVPHILIHLCSAIEARGLTEEGLYRVGGSDPAVTKLVEEFLWGRGIPNLLEVDVPTMTSAVKRFLKNLKEPIICRTQWHDFYRAATMTDKMDREVHLYDAINKLPFANRDTLAYLCLHLQRVAENSQKNKMTLENLSLVLAPTIVGFSADEPSEQRMHQETLKQRQIMDALLEISGDYWAGFVKNNDVQPLMLGASPGLPPTPSSSMLGSWNPAKNDQKDTTFTATPRYRTRQQQNKGFFQKPWR